MQSDEFFVSLLASPSSGEGGQRARPGPGWPLTTRTEFRGQAELVANNGAQS